jgi:hypothetical protein
MLDSSAGRISSYGISGSNLLSPRPLLTAGVESGNGEQRYPYPKRFAKKKRKRKERKKETVRLRGPEPG